MATSRDPYQVLGVGKTASIDAIKQAYRRLAKQYHPDLNPGRADIEQRFKEISSAYTLLSDSEKRARYDRGEIDANGSERVDRTYYRARNPRGPTAGAHRSSGDPFGTTGAGPSSGSSADDFFSFADFFGGGRKKSNAGSGTGAGSSGAKARGSDIAYSVTVSFTDAALGARRRVTLSNGKNIDITIPPGTEDQQKLRLKNQGMDGVSGGPAGDAIIEVRVDTHSFFSRNGQDIHIDVPVTLPEAVLGANIKVPTLDGQVMVKIPPGSNTGTTLRLRGKGVTDPKTKVAGDQYVKLKVVLPDPLDPELTQFIEKWAKDRSYDVRKKVGMG
ncbi:Molecular chaperone DnaJ [Azospirillaceae bacterium]